MVGLGVLSFRTGSGQALEGEATLFGLKHDSEYDVYAAIYREFDTPGPLQVASLGLRACERGTAASRHSRHPRRAAGIGRFARVAGGVCGRRVLGARPARGRRESVAWAVRAGDAGGPDVPLSMQTACIPMGGKMLGLRFKF